MDLQFITLSGANEFTDITELLKFATYNSIDMLPNANPLEFAIQSDRKKAAFGTARYWWLMALYNYIRFMPTQVNFALHINNDWAEKFYQGQLDEDLERLLALKIRATSLPFIGRVQINYPDNIGNNYNAEKAVNLMHKFLQTEFIFQYNEKSKDYVHKLYECTDDFSCLIDASRGQGIIPKQWIIPEFKNIKFGFAGGLSAQTLGKQFPKILSAIEEDTPFWIDAESGLKDGNGRFSLKKCQQYLEKFCKVAKVSYY